MAEFKDNSKRFECLQMRATTFEDLPLSSYNSREEDDSCLIEEEGEGERKRKVVGRFLLPYPAA